MNIIDKEDKIIDKYISWVINVSDEKFDKEIDTKISELISDMKMLDEKGLEL